MSKRERYRRKPDAAKSRGKQVIADRGATSDCAKGWSEVPRRRIGPYEGLFLACILILAFVLRAWGASWGLPYGYHPDEHNIAGRALRMVDSGDLNPHWFVYPTFYTYIQATVMGITRYLFQHLSSEPLGPLQLHGRLYLAGRYVTVTLATMTMLLVHLAGRRLGGPLVGLGGATILCLSSLHVTSSQNLMTDVPSAFFVALCLWLALRGAAGDGDRWFVLAGAAAGLAAGTKYNAGLCLVLPLSLWVSRQWKSRAFFSRTPFLTVLFCGVAFLAVMPWAVLDTRTVLEWLNRQWLTYSGGVDGWEGAIWKHYPAHLWHRGLTPGPTLLVLLGWVGLAVNERPKWLALSTFIIFYYVLLASAGTWYARNLMPVMPLLAVVGGYGIAWIVETIHSRLWSWRLKVLASGLAALLAIGAFGWPARLIVRHNQRILLPSTRTISAEWIAKNIPPGTTFGMEDYTPRISRKRYNVLWSWAIWYRPLNEYQEAGCDYVVVSSGLYGRYYRDTKSYPQKRAFYEYIFTHWELVAEFTGEEGCIQGPTIRIFRVPSKMSQEKAER